MRRVAIVLGVLVLLLVLAAVAGWVALQRIDWNQYKEPIAQAAYDATGRRLDLSGDIDLEIGLKPGVSVAGIGFQNAAWGSRPQMATVDRFVVRLELLPLLFGNVVVDRVELRGLDLLLETNAKGVPNWEFTPPKPPEGAPPEEKKPATSPPAPEGPEGKGGEASKPYTALVRRAEIENAVVVIRDARTGSSQRIAIERLVTLMEGEGAPLQLDLSAHYGDAPIEVTGTLDGVSDVMAGAPLGVNLAAQAGGAKIGVDGKVGKPLEGGNLDLGVKVSGEHLAALGALTGGELPDLGPYGLEMKLTGGGQAYAIRDLVLRMGSTSLTGTVDVKLGGARPRLDARLTSPHIALADFQDAGAKTSAETAKGSSAPAAAGSAPAEGGATGSQKRLFSADPLPLEGLAAADAVLRLQSKEIDLGSLLLTGFDLDLKLDDRNLQLKKLAADVAGGHLDLAVTLDASKKPPPLVARAQAHGVELGKLLASQGNDMLTGGPLDLAVDLTGRGASVRDIMASLNGSLLLEMGTATLAHDTAALVLADASSLLRAEPVSKQAQVSCAYADFAVRDGVARPDGLVVDLSAVALFGEGKVDLREEKLKLKFDRQALSVSVADALPPFTVKGTLAEPKAGVDAAALATRALDLGAGLLDKKKRKESTPKVRPVGCRNLLAEYRKEMQERGSTADVTERAMDALGEKTGKEGKKVLDAMKGLLGR